MAQSIATAEIVQAAFGYAEMPPPSSLGDDSAPARAAAALYPISLDGALERADWSFASSLLKLSEVTVSVVDEELPHTYVPDGSILRIRDVRPAGTAWRRDGTYLRADAPGPLLIRATVRVPNETLLPAVFKDFVALDLAAKMAGRFATSANRAQILSERAHDALREALSADARQASTRRWDGGTGDGDWVAAVTRGVLR